MVAEFYREGWTLQDVTGWTCDSVGPFQRVLPANDSRTHNKGVDCWCSPRYEEGVGYKIVTHNSADGREAYDSGERRKN